MFLTAPSKSPTVCPSVTWDRCQTESARLARFGARIHQAIATAACLVRSRKPGGVAADDFNIRGELYDLANQVAPHARRDEIEAIRRGVAPEPGELAVDFAAGSGFLTSEVCDWTGHTVYAVEPSETQLRCLRKNAPKAVPIHAFPDHPSVVDQLPAGEVDFITSLAGLHHVDDQRAMFANAAALLRPGGRMVLGDVCGGTTVSRHFDTEVTARSLTGHTAQWLDERRVGELIDPTRLRITHLELAPLAMRFSEEEEMCLFYKGLHGFDLDCVEIGRLVRSNLRVVEGETLDVHWPLLIARLERV